MDERLAADTPGQSAEFDTALVEGPSREYVGRWHRLVSTTNWEKGRIICEWRKSLMEAPAPSETHSDEAWSRRVGNVSPQHVGRLRRVYERFGQVHQQYAGLYWSHFQAALDWHDAEMWLEGAVQSGWSVAQMRTTRWDALGAPAHKKPKPEDVIVAELDEDVDPGLDESHPDTLGESIGVVQAPRSDASEAGAIGAAASGRSGASTQEPADATPMRPFEDVPEDVPPLPRDLTRAFKALRLAILKHKLSGWEEIPCEQVLAAIDALRQLALAPTGD